MIDNAFIYTTFDQLRYSLGSSNESGRAPGLLHVRHALDFVEFQPCVVFLALQHPLHQIEHAPGVLRDVVCRATRPPPHGHREQRGWFLVLVLMMPQMFPARCRRRVEVVPLRCLGEVVVRELCLYFLAFLIYEWC